MVQALSCYAGAAPPEYPKELQPLHARLACALMSQLGHKQKRRQFEKTVAGPLVDEVKRKGDQPFGHYLFVPSACGLIGMDRPHHFNADDFERLADSRPVLPGSTLPRHGFLTAVDDLARR